MKVVRVEISRDDGSTISLEGATATEWDEQVKAACQSAWIHGMRFETLPWRVSTDSVSEEPHLSWCKRQHDGPCGLLEAGKTVRDIPPARVNEPHAVCVGSEVYGRHNYACALPHGHEGPHRCVREAVEPPVGVVWRVDAEGGWNDRYRVVGPWRSRRDEAEADAEHASMRGALPETHWAETPKGDAEWAEVVSAQRRSAYERGRTEALEAAARIADRNDKSAWGIAREIRALKPTPTGSADNG